MQNITLHGSVTYSRSVKILNYPLNVNEIQVKHLQKNLASPLAITISLKILLVDNP